MVAISPEWRSRLRTNSVVRSVPVVVGLVIALAISSVFVPSFLSVSNVPNVLQQMSIVGIVAVGMTFVILTGGIDLSVGSNLAVCTVLYSLALSHHWPSTLALLVALGAGLVFGAVNGLGIAVFKIQPFIMTLATLAVGQGIALSITNAAEVIFTSSSPLITVLGSGSIGIIPTEFLVLAVIVAVGMAVLRLTPFGRHVYATGGSSVAARLTGIRVNTIVFSVYAIAGLLSGLAAAMTAALLGAGVPTAGGTTNLDAIAAVVIGGTSLFGGVGGLRGTVVGAAVLASVSNILNLVGVSPNTGLIVRGALIAVTVLLVSPDLRGWVRGVWTSARGQTAGSGIQQAERTASK